MQHKLSDVDAENRTATCILCGPVKIYKKSSNRAGFMCVEVKKNDKTSYDRDLDKWVWSSVSDYAKFKEVKCERCGLVPEDPCQLDVDHINGRSGEKPHRPENLQTLCANCHRLKTHRPELFAKSPNR